MLVHRGGGGVVTRVIRCTVVLKAKRLVGNTGGTVLVKCYTVPVQNTERLSSASNRRDSLSVASVVCRLRLAQASSGTLGTLGGDSDGEVGFFSGFLDGTGGSDQCTGECMYMHTHTALASSGTPSTHVRFRTQLSSICVRLPGIEETTRRRT